MRSFYIHTFGCQMNVHDSQRMSELLQESGLVAAPQIDQADLIVVNTCSVREKAEFKLDSELGKLKHYKRREQPAVIAVAGCVAQQRGDSMLARMPFIDIVIGPDNLRELPALATAASTGAAPVVRTEFDDEAPTFLNARSTYDGAPSTYVAISKGCGERCSFCIVPYTRGAERHRPSDDILGEIDRLTISGAREVILLGQTVNGYRDPTGGLGAFRTRLKLQESDFASLLRRIAEEVPNLRRLRYTSPHPRYFDCSVVQAHAELDVLCRHVHMPVQSGSDAVLRRMVRRHTREEYIDTVRSLRKGRPDLTVSTDLIVGFPGETDEDFEQTLSLMSEVGFVGVYGFKYSPRPGTPSLRLDNDVPEPVKSQRLTRVFALADELTAAHLEPLVGTVQVVLVEAVSDRGAGQLTGHTERNEIVHLVDDGTVRVGELVRVRITRAFRHSLEGEPAENARNRKHRLPVLADR